MERFVINFINFMISSGGILGWREFNIRILLSKIVSDGDRRSIRNGIQIPIGDSNWNDVDNWVSIEQYLINNQLAEIIRSDNEGKTLRFTDKGKSMINFGSVDAYMAYAFEQVQLQDQVMRLAISNYQIGQTQLGISKAQVEIAKAQTKLQIISLLVNGGILMGTAVAAIYYVLEVRSHHVGFYGKTFPILFLLLMPLCCTSILAGIYYLMKSKDK